jgi:hypothetical protein
MADELSRTGKIASVPVKSNTNGKDTKTDTKTTVDKKKAAVKPA